MAVCGPGTQEALPSGVALLGNKQPISCLTNIAPARPWGGKGGYTGIRPRTGAYTRRFTACGSSHVHKEFNFTEPTLETVVIVQPFMRGTNYVPRDFAFCKQ
jgi:hypothetical protein